MSAKINYARILETRECPGCISNKPGRKSDCMIKLHVVYGKPVAENMRAWIEKQIFSGRCKQRRAK